tara:strand:- start:238 stop:702 length:465 start_codon:yes stop_codon:yes gene_type:complete
MSTLILFCYLPDCNACAKLRELIKPDTKIKYVDLSKETVSGYNIEKVPTLIVKQDGKKTVYEGKECFDYLSKLEPLDFVNITNNVNKGLAFADFEGDLDKSIRSNFISIKSFTQMNKANKPECLEVNDVKTNDLEDKINELKLSREQQNSRFNI